MGRQVVTIAVEAAAGWWGVWRQVGERLVEVAEVGRQHSWYHGPKPDILTCLTNSCLCPLHVSVVFSISLCAGFGWIGGAFGGGWRLGASY